MDPQLGAVACRAGDLFLLCSDGMNEGLYEHQIVDILRTKKAGVDLAKTLVESAVKADGRDNTTALVVRVG